MVFQIDHSCLSREGVVKVTGVLVILSAPPDPPASLHPSPLRSVSWDTALHRLSPWISLSSSSQLGLT